MLSQIYLAFNAVGIGLIGLAYLYDPNLLLARYGLEAGSAGMDSMMRASYGGIFLACAVAFTLGALQPGRRQDAVGLVVLFMAGAALGRLLSLAVAGQPPATIMPLLYFECIAALIGIILYIRSGRSSEAGAGG